MQETHAPKVDEEIAENPTKSFDSAWQSIPVPQGVALDAVRREPSTHGFIYTIWYTPSRQVVWISQSIPAMVKKINSLLAKSKEDRLHASSIYRIIRGECSRRMHKNYRAMKWSRDSLEHLNPHIQEFESCIFISKCPDQWHVSQRESAPEGEAEAPEEASPAKEA
jgi:hypothetical protein